MTGQGPRQVGTARPPRRRRSWPRRGSPLGHDRFPVVGLGASAGGLDAFRRLLAVLPAGTGMAFILIQHLDPTHASMMVDLLTGHTPLKVREAADGMPLEREHIYLIPPGAYLSIRGGALRLSEQRERHGARLPFDFFLRSLAEELGERALCLILSGTDGDGSLGLKAVKEKAGSSSRRIPTRPSTSRRAAAIVSWPTWNCLAPFRLPRFPRHISVGE